MAFPVKKGAATTKKGTGTTKKGGKKCPTCGGKGVC